MIRLSLLPSFKEKPVVFSVDDGFYLTNASVAVHDGQVLALVCGGDHYMDARGIFVPWPPGTREDNNRFSKMTVHLARFNPNDLELVSYTAAIGLAPDQVPTPEGPTFKGFRGFDSARLFVWRDTLYMAACVMGTGGKPEAAFYMAEIEEDSLGTRFADVRRIIPRLPAPSYAEKNWMPEVIGDELRFHYRLGVLSDPEGNLTEVGNPLPPNGSSQVIPYKDGALCIVHEFVPVPGSFRRSYWHQFALLDKAGRPVKLSDRLCVAGLDPEIITGLAHHPDGKRIILSYGRGKKHGADRYQETPFLATLDLAQLETII